MKRRLSVLIAAVLIVVLAAACSNQSANEPQPSGTASAAPKAADASASKEVPTIRLMTQNHPAWPFNADWPVWDIMAKGAKVNLQPSGIQGDWWETIPLIIASGDMPDLLWISGLDSANEYGGDGALINYLDHLDKMPNLQAFIKKYPETVNSLLSADGKMYLQPTEGAFSDLASFFMYRKDIFEKNNIQIPDTYEDFHNVLKQLKEMYPDSYPWTFNSGLNYLNAITYSWDTQPDYYYNTENKQAAYGPVEDNYKAMVEFLHQLYEEKLISPEFLTMDSKQRDSLVSNGKSFVYGGYIDELDTYNTNVRQTDPDFTLAEMTPPAGPGGKRYHGPEQRAQIGLMVTSTTKHLDAALGLIDWMYSEEGMEALSWGIEGETYTIGADGNKHFLKDKIANSTQMRQNYGLGAPGTMGWIDPNRDLDLMSGEARAAVTEAEKYVDHDDYTPIVFTTAESDELSLKTEAIGKYTEENISKFIVGNRPMSEWNDYVAGYQKLGLDEVLNTYTAAYERTLANQLK